MYRQRELPRGQARGVFGQRARVAGPGRRSGRLIGGIARRAGRIARTGVGRALGLVQYSLMHRSLSGGMVVYLSDLFTVPEARGRGVGRALIDHVRGFAVDRGYPSVRWLTHEGNGAARALYDTYAPASGFILYAVAP